MTKIKTVIFDLGNVVVKHNNPLLYKRLSQHSSVSPEKVKKELKSRIGIEFDKGELKPKEFYRKFSDSINLKLNYKDFKKIWSSHFSRNKPMEKLVRKLKDSYEIFLLSNTNKLDYEFLEERYPILNIFDKTILSFEVKSRKPKLKIFEEIFNRTNSNPEECIFTDNKIEYVRVAEKLGINGIHFKGIKEFKRKLKKIGIKKE